MWLTIILILGGLICFLEIAMETIVVLLEDRGIIKASSAEWFNNDTLQLQRMAHEELGLGHWEISKIPQNIPVTEKGQLLGVLDCSDRKHPRLVNPATIPRQAKNEKLDSPVVQEVQVEEIKADIKQCPSYSSQNSDDGVNSFAEGKTMGMTEANNVASQKSTATTTSQLDKT